MAEKQIPAALKTGLELGPVVAFFVVYMFLKDDVFVLGGTEYTGFILVTAGFIPIFLASMALLWRLTGHLSPMQIVTAVIIVVFGGLSVWLNDERFFKMKPTLIYLLFGGLLGVGLLRGQSWLKVVMEGVMPLQDKGWMILTRRFTALFLGFALANEIIWRSFPTETWVWVKTFGFTGAIFVFFVTQSGLMQRYALDESTDGTPDENSGGNSGGHSGGAADTKPGE